MTFLFAILTTLFVALLEALTVEHYLKPRWKHLGWSELKNTVRLFGFALFSLFYVATFWLDWRVGLEYAILHVFGVEDLAHGLWVRFVADPLKAWENSETVDLAGFELPGEWPWLGYHSGPWALNPFKVVLVTLGGEKVELVGLIVASIIGTMAAAILAFLFTL